MRGSTLRWPRGMGRFGRQGAYRQQETLPHKLATADRALGADPEATYAMHAKAVALRRLGNPEDAEATLVKALRLDPAHDDVRFELFALKSRPSLGEPEPEILELGLRLIDLAPPQPTLIASVANAHCRANEQENALRLSSLCRMPGTQAMPWEEGTDSQEARDEGLGGPS